MEPDHPAGTATAWPPPTPRYRPDIEGLRAIAVVMVVAFHARVPGFAGGFVGVDVFFVLSGYLITWLLVAEAATHGRVDLLRFYARRARRLLPAVALMLLVTMVVTMVLYAPVEQRRLARSWAATALYVSNLDFAVRSLDYHGAAAERNPLLHTWSLSVEEQFYLVWPWLILGGLGVLRWQRRWRSSRRAADGAVSVVRHEPSRPAGPDAGDVPAATPRTLLVLLTATTALSFLLSLVMTYTRGGWAFYLSPTRAWEFGAGGLAMLLPLRAGPLAGAADPRRRVARLGGWAALAGLGAACLLLDNQTPFPGVAALLPVGATIVLLRAGAAQQGSDTNHDDSRLGALLGARPMQWLGRLSYSWYLWHWPALVFAASLIDPLSAGARLAAVMLSLLVAWGSFTFVENPLRHSRRLALRPQRSFVLAAAVMAVSLALSAGWWQASRWLSASGAQGRIARVTDDLPSIYPDQCDHFGSAELVACVYGDTAAPRTVVLLGDSHAGQFFPAVRAAAEQAGARLVVLTLSGCPVAELPAMFNGVLRRSYPECVTWRREALDRIRRLHPAVTFVASANVYDVSPEQWEAGTRAALRELAEGTDELVMILDPPMAGFDVPACLAQAAWRPGTRADPDCRPRGDAAASVRAAAQERAARAEPAVRILDVRDDVCVIGSCDATADGLVRYRDAGHLSRAFARTFAPAFAAYLAPARTPGATAAAAGHGDAPAAPAVAGAATPARADGVVRPAALDPEPLSRAPTRR